MNNKTVINAGWIIACRIVQALLALVVTMVSARYLGPANYGLVNYAASIVSFLKPIMELGFNAILVKELVDRPDQEGVTLGTAMCMNTLSAIVCIIGAVSLAAAMNPGEPDTVLVCALYSISLVFLALEMVQYWFQAHLISKYVSLTVLFAYVVVSVYKLWLLISGKSIYWFAVSNALDYFLISIILIVLYRRLGGQPFGFSFSRARDMLESGKYYIVSGLMVTIFAQTDRIMLKLLIDEEAVGYYSTAATCAGLTGFVIIAMIDSFRPGILEQKKRSQQQFEDEIAKLYSVISYFSLAMSCATVLFSEFIVGILYGKAYLEAIPLLKVIVWYTTFSYLGSIRNIWILAEGKQQYLWIINVSGALGNVFLNCMLIPRYGAMGAAVATLLTQVFTNVVLGYFLKPIRQNNRLMLRGLSLRWLKQG